MTFTEYCNQEDPAYMPSVWLVKGEVVVSDQVFTLENGRKYKTCDIVFNGKDIRYFLFEGDRNLTAVHNDRFNDQVTFAPSCFYLGKEFNVWDLEAYIFG